MKKLFVDTILELGYPVFPIGSLMEDEPYPETFFTYWNNAADGAEFYDNTENGTVWDFDLSCYSVDPDLVQMKLMEAKSLLKKNGFIVTGKGYDVASDESTHTGRGINVLKIER